MLNVWKKIIWKRRRRPADSDDESSQVSDLSMGLIEDFEGKDSDDDERKRDDVLRQSLRLEIRSGAAECIVNYLL